MNRLLLVAALGLGAGCYIGPDVMTYEPANSPAGVLSTVLLVNDSTIVGELLYASQGSISLLVANELIEIPSTIIDRLRIKGSNGAFMIKRSPITEVSLSILRPRSRFPAGIPDAALDKMLSTRDQTEVRIVTIDES